MRILLWSEAFLPSIGGVEILAAAFSEALDARGHRLSIIVNGKNTEGAPEYNAMPVHRFDFDQVLASRDIRRYSAMLRDLRHLMRDFQPELIHVFHLGAGVFFQMQAAESVAVPSVVTLHQHLPDSQVQPDHLYGRILRRTSFITACSQAVLRITRSQVPEIAHRSCVIHNSLKSPLLEPTPPAPGPPRLLCVGRLVYQKGFDLAIDAFQQVLRQFPMARLSIAGDGPLRQELEAHADRLGLGQSVDFLGWVDTDRVPFLISTATALLVPSRAEPFGLVTVQAGQAGRAVIAARVGGLPEIVIDRETGILFEKENSAALANAIIELHGHPDQLAVMGRKARLLVEQKFGWERFLTAYEDLYRNLCAG
ncbi:MAG TPA: glycosyltransferase family 4 protein [Anaerolineae bacterium]